MTRDADIERIAAVLEAEGIIEGLLPDRLYDAGLRPAPASPEPPEGLRAALAFIADWAHDCDPENNAGHDGPLDARLYGFGAIEERARAALAAGSVDRVPLDVPMLVAAMAAVGGRVTEVAPLMYAEAIVAEYTHLAHDGEGADHEHTILCTNGWCEIDDGGRR